MNTVTTNENIKKIVIGTKTVKAYESKILDHTIYQMDKPITNDYINILKENNIPIVNDYSIFFICGFAILLLVLLVISGLLEKHYKKTNELFSKINEVSNEQLTTAQVRQVLVILHATTIIITCRIKSTVKKILLQITILLNHNLIK